MYPRAFREFSTGRPFLFTVRNHVLVGYFVSLASGKRSCMVQLLSDGLLSVRDVLLRARFAAVKDVDHDRPPLREPIA
jgi:hypothetical protein